MLAGQSGLNLLPEAVVEWYAFLSVTALTMVAFLLGSSLTRRELADYGRVILWISVSVVVVTWGLVSGGLWLAGASPGLALLLGAIATATAPAATLDVLRQSGITSPFTETLKGIVAIDDVWGLIVFSLALALAGMFNGTPVAEAAELAVWEMGGAVGLGLAVGLPAAFLTGRISAGDPLRTEALAIVFLTAGLSIWIGVSFLIAGMTAGAVIVNLARHHDRAFHEIEHIQWPFMVLFFVLAGASLEVSHLAEIGVIGGVFVGLRTVSRVLGAGLGAWLGGAPRREARWYGVALLPQAGVAVGMSLIAGETFPEIAQPVLTVTIASTMIFEIIGPLATMLAVRRVSRQN
jgi:Kef-type K+ transport system membrane component KefB